MTNLEVFDLDMEEVGWALVNALATSATLRHQHVADSLRDYVCPEALPPEAKFVWDVLTRSTGDAATEWFGSRLDASAYASRRLMEIVAASRGHCPEEPLRDTEPLPQDRM